MHWAIEEEGLNPHLFDVFLLVCDELDLGRFSITSLFPCILILIAL